MRLPHMGAADSARTPTLTLFAAPNCFLRAGARNVNAPCVTEQPGFAWSHGDVQSDITVTWLGMVGPGVKHLGATGDVWSDHTDVRPTMLTLLGLQDDYAHDGRTLFEVMYDWAVPQTVRAHRETL